MTMWSWLYMGIVWAAITALNVYCFYIIFTKKAGDKDKSRDE